MKNYIIKFLTIYKYFISSFMKHNCRFYPSCSSYFLLAIQKLSLYKSILLCIRRIFKCSCLFSGGYDPVP